MLQNQNAEFVDNEDQTRKKQTEYNRRLYLLSANLLAKRDAAVRFRAGSGIERRWREDEQAFYGDLADHSDGAPMVDYAIGAAYPSSNKGPARSQARTNVLRSKCEVAAGRFAEILLPSGQKNWGLKPTPVPDLVKAINDDRQVTNAQTNEPMVNEENGEPVLARDIAKVQIDKAKEAMEGMEREIEDQLTECGFRGESALVIDDAVMVGTGIMKGPSVRKSVSRAYVRGDDDKWVMKTKEDHSPTSERVNYWNVFPAEECGQNVRRAPYIWESGEILPRELRALIGVEGYFDNQILAVLREEPTRTSTDYVKRSGEYKIKRRTVETGSGYEMWEYHGDISVEDLEAIGVENIDEIGGKNISACVVFVNERPIKIILQIIDTGDLIYDFFTWTPMKDSPWGIGVVRQGIWWQRIIQAAWRTMLDNARDSSGAQVLVGKGVEPADNRWEITGKKIWRVMTTDADNDVRKMFNQFQLQNNQGDLQAIIDLAMRFLDIETSLPMLFQGEKSDQVPDVLGIVDIMVDSSNVAIKTRVQRWDFSITEPHIKRYYIWNMEYAEDESIKGDYKAKAIGASVLLAKDRKIRGLLQINNLRGDPNAENEISWSKVYTELAKSLDLDILKSKEEKRSDEEKRAEAGGQPQDPGVQTATIRSEGEMAKAKLTQESDMKELEFKEQQARADREFKMQMKEFDVKIRMMEFAQERGLKLEEVKAEFAKEASKQNLMRELTDKKAKTAQLTTPAIEPPGRAKEGEAFQA